MCGISGAIGDLDSSVLDCVREMNESQLHRGPDGQGFWHDVGESDGKGVALAHRRLSIIDLSEAGAQPMVESTTGVVISYNGEVYNFKELRDELSQEGVVFDSDSDTEVVLRAYVRWGVDFLERLRGMFALAIWDPMHRRLVLARDRLGIKPLYLAWIPVEGGGRALLFASELRALLASGRIERKLDPEGLHSYLWNGFVVGPTTMVSGVELLPAGTHTVIDLDDSKQAPTRYWSLPVAQEGTTDASDMWAELGDAVAMRMVSDVPIAVFLSGGVDSSVIATLASRACDAPVRTFNIGFEEEGFDESDYAKHVSKVLGTQHDRILLRESDFASQLEDALAALDQPSYDALNTYVISRAVREAGITVALAGTGGDELFGGYSSFRDLPTAIKWSRRASMLPQGLLRGLASGVSRYKFGASGEIPPQTRWGKLGDVLATRGDVFGAYQVSYAKFTSRFLDELEGGSGDERSPYGVAPGRVAELRELVDGQPCHQAISSMELAFFTGERLLRDTDCVSMAVSLEVRVPLLDHRVVETAAGLDAQTRYAPLGAKRMLREAVRDELPPSFFERPKAGFVLPIDRWAKGRLRGELDATFADRELCESIGLDHAAVSRLWRAYQAGSPGLYWSRIWGIFVLLWWCRRLGMSL